jgi:hypothetical protein
MRRFFVEHPVPPAPADLRLDAEDIAAGGVLHHPRDGVKSRVGGMASLHVTEGGTVQAREALLSILDEYLGPFGPGVERFRLPREKRFRRYAG